MSDKKTWEVFRRATAWPSRFLFGDDIFISYSRADGVTYAAGLADELAGRKFSCRFDLWGSEPGKEMPNSLRRALSRSAVLVLVGTPSAAKSKHVAQEVAELKRRGRKIVPVAFDGVVLRNGLTVTNGRLTKAEPVANAVLADEALWAADIEGLPLSCEQTEALKTGDPSPEVLSRIDKTFTFARKDERLRKTTTGVAALLLVLIGASVVAAYVAAKKGREATVKTEQAAKAESRASASAQRAREQEEKAQQETARAELAAQKAADAEQLAGEKTKLADEKTKLADAATRRADEQTAKADEASRRAAAQEMSAHKNLARSYYAQAQAESNTNPLRALAWASKAVQEAPVGDENKSSYVVRALNLASRTPFTVINTPAGLMLASFSPSGDTVVTFSEAGKFSVWDGHTGEALAHPFPDPSLEYPSDLYPPLGAAFSSDGSRIALLVQKPGSGGVKLELHLLVWEARTGRTVQDIRVEGRVKRQRALKFSSDDQEIVIESNDEADGISVWKVASGKERTYKTPIKKSRWSWYSDPPVSSNPTRNWFLNVRDAETTTNGAQQVSSEVVEVRDIVTGDLVAELPLVDKKQPHAEIVKQVAFTPDAQKVIILSEHENDNTDSRYEGKQGVLRVWDIVNRRVSTPRRLNLPNSEGNDYSIEVGAPGSPRRYCTSRDGKRLLIMDRKFNHILIWDISGEPDWKSTISGPEPASGEKLELEHAFFTDDDQHIVGILREEDSDREINVWSAQNYHRVSQPFFLRHDALRYAVSPQDKTVSAIYQDGTLLSWDLMHDSSISTVAPELPITADIVFDSATLTPDRRSLLTVGYHHDARKQNSSRVMQLWDTATGVKKWPAEIAAPLWPQQVKFSSDGSHFIVLPRDRYDLSQNGIAPRQTSDGATVPGFRAITEHLDQVEFSREGTKLVTESWLLDGSVIKLWSATTGQPLNGAGFDLPARDGLFLGFTRYGEYFVMLPPAYKEDSNYSEIRLTKVDSQRQTIRLRFADHNTAALAVALLRQAHEIGIEEEKGVVATLPSGIKISIASSSAGALINQTTKAQLFPPLDSQADLSQLVLSPDGRMVATTFSEDKKTLARVWDLSTAQPLSERLWSEDEIKDMAFTPDSTKLLITDKYGVMRSWLFQDSKGDAPAWMTYMSEALGGLRVAGGTDVQRISPEEYTKMRREFVDLLRAAASGDERARFLLSSRKR